MPKNNKGTSAKTEYVGVNWVERFGRYRSTIVHKGKAFPCGIYDTPREAAIARDKAIIKLGMDQKRLQILKSVIV